MCKIVEDLYKGCAKSTEPVNILSASFPLLGKVQSFVLFFKLQFRESALCDVIEGGDMSLTCRHPQASDLPSPFHLSVGSSLFFVFVFCSQNNRGWRLEGCKQRANFFSLFFLGSR